MLSNTGLARLGLSGGMSWICGNWQSPLLRAHLIVTDYSDRMKLTDVALLAKQLIPPTNDTHLGALRRRNIFPTEIGCAYRHPNFPPTKCSSDVSLPISGQTK